MIRALEILTFTSSTNVLCLKIHIHMKRTILTANKDGRHSLPPHLSLNAHQQNETLQNSILEQHMLQQQCSNLDSGAYSPN